MMTRQVQGAWNYKMCSPEEEWEKFLMTNVCEVSSVSINISGVFCQKTILIVGSSNEDFSQFSIYCGRLLMLQCTGREDLTKQCQLDVQYLLWTALGAVVYRSRGPDEAVSA